MCLLTFNNNDFYNTQVFIELLIYEHILKHPIANYATGSDPTNPAKYHPFYITDSPEGGFGQKSEAEQRRQRVFAGVSYDSEGYPYPTAGKLFNLLLIF